MIGRRSYAVTTLEHNPELGTKAVVEPGVEEGAATGGAHGAQVAQQRIE